jgi:predicted transcriptional regulator
VNTQEYLTAIRQKHNLASDYAVAKFLQISKQAVSRYGKGDCGFDDDIACKVADALAINPGIVVLDMHRERAKNTRAKAVWQDIFRNFLTPSSRAKSGRRLAFSR